MKITDVEPIVVEVNQRGNWVFVQVHTDVGLIGLGEASHSGDDFLLVATVRRFKQQLLGRSPLNIEAIWHDLVGLRGGGRISQTALSSIEQALWDILGQHLGAPIHTLLGGMLHQHLRLYANINRHVVDRSAEGFARAACQAVDEGFTAIKLAPFDEVNGNNRIRTGKNATWQPGVERVRAVRAAIGDEVELAVDCHGRLDIVEAITVGQLLADCNLMWYEEPIHHSRTADLIRITQSVPMHTASAEQVFGIEGFRPFLTHQVVGVLMPDVKHDGGLLETKQIAEAARINHLLVAPHNPSGPVATVASAHVSTTLRNFLILEYAWGEVAWREALLIPSEPIENGFLTLSDKPGLGHRLNLDVVEKHRISLAN